MLTTSRVNDFSFATYVRVVIKPRPQSEITKFCVRTLKSSQILSKVIRFNLKFDHLTSPFATLVFVLTVNQPWRHETCFASLTLFIAPESAHKEKIPDSGVDFCVAQFQFCRVCCLPWICWQTGGIFWRVQVISVNTRVQTVISALTRLRQSFKSALQIGFELQSPWRLYPVQLIVSSAV